jgi:hypothetical protein
MTVEGFCRPAQPAYQGIAQAQYAALSPAIPASAVERPVNCVWFGGNDQIGWHGPFRETFEEGSLRKVEQ